MSKSKFQVLVPIDFSEISLIALEKSYYIAKSFHAEIVLLYVIEHNTPYFTNKLYTQKGEVEKIEQTAKEYLNKLVEKTKEKCDIKATIMVEKGLVHEKILDVSERINPIMIIMGKKSKETTRRKGTGSNTMGVIRASKRPVLSVKGVIQKKDIKKILLPIELYRNYDLKVKLATNLARVLGTSIDVLGILKSGSTGLKFRLQSKKGIIKREIEKANVNCTTHLIKSSQGAFYKTVISHSIDIDADIILTMTRDENNYREYYIDENAFDIIENSDIPVLCINPFKDMTENILVPMVDPFGVYQDR